MAYYPYQNQYYSQIGQYTHQQNSNGLIWIQGVEAAKSYMVAPNCTVLLMDAESPKFYLKTADASGMPMLRVFEYTEIANNGANKPTEAQVTDMSSYATKAEFDAFRDEINGILKHIAKGEKDNAESAV